MASPRACSVADTSPFIFAIVACLIAAMASLLRGRRPISNEAPPRPGAPVLSGAPELEQGIAS